MSQSKSRFFSYCFRPGAYRLGICMEWLAICLFLFHGAMHRHGADIEPHFHSGESVCGLHWTSNPPPHDDELALAHHEPDSPSHQESGSRHETCHLCLLLIGGGVDLAAATASGILSNPFSFVAGLAEARLHLPSLLSACVIPRAPPAASF